MFRRRGTYLIVVLLLLAWTIGVVAGCGGGEETTTTTKNAVATTVGSSGSTDSKDDLLGKPLATTDSTPAEYTEAIEQGRPVVLLFYVPGSVDDVQVLDSLTALQEDFDDYVFLLYDYSVPSSYGDLSTLLEVNYPPELVLVDGLGIPREIWNGYVDEGTLNQGLVNLGQI
jgi:hypothetical protein